MWQYIASCRFESIKVGYKGVSSKSVPTVSPPAPTATAAAARAAATATAADRQRSGGGSLSLYPPGVPRTFDLLRLASSN